MEENRSDKDALIVLVKRRKKKIIKDFIDQTLQAKQKFTVFKLPPSNRGGNNKDREKKKK